MQLVQAPEVTVNIIPAGTKVPNEAQRVLLVGQLGTGATQPSGIIVENVKAPPENTDPFDPYFWTTGSPEILFGPDSELCRMIRAFKEINEVTQLDVYPYPIDGPSTANSDFTLTGAATADGTLRLQVTSPFYELVVPITNGDSNTDIITNLLAEAALNPTLLVTLTDLGAGSVRFESKSVGLYAASTAAVRILQMDATGIAFGQVNSPVPNFDVRTGADLLLDALSNQRYQTIVMADPGPATSGTFPDPTATIKPIFEKWNVDNDVQDFIMITGYPFPDDDSNTPVTEVLPTTSEQMLIYMTDRGKVLSGAIGLSAPIDMCFSMFQHFPVMTTQLAAIRSLRLSPGEDISQYVIARQGLLDAFGGPALASKPYFNTPLDGITHVEGDGFGFSEAELRELNNVGGFTAGLNQAKTETIFGQIPTTYKTDIAGNPDISFKWMNYTDTISGSREYFFNNLKKRFAQSRLTNGDVVKGRDMANVETISAFCETLYQDLSGRDFVLLEAGEEATTFFKNNLTVVIDTSLGKATVGMRVPIVTQLRKIIATMQLSFGTEG